MLGIFTAALSLTIGFILGVIALVSSGFASLSAGILHWVTAGNFITLSYTNAGVLPGDPRFNEFVSLGWELTRGLTNIIFVIAMIAIGLGTALGKAEYQAKKALPTLIIIALLINFTPVLLGLVIDASNIVMNYFLNAVGGFDFFLNNMGAALNLISTTLGKFWDPSAQLNLVIGLLVMIIFSILAGIVFFLFSLLFIGRYIALWLLVILSPFALACYILPATKKYYTQWLEQLSQWCIIGITGSFFLYLASKMIEISGKVKIAETSDVVGKILGANITNQILPWGISLALMFIGLSMGLTTGAMGGSMAINWGKKAGMAMGGLAARQTAGRYFAAQRRRIEEGKGSWLQKLEGFNFGASGFPGTKKWKEAPLWKKTIGTALAPFTVPLNKGIRFGTREALKYGAQQPVYIDKETEKWEKEAKADISNAITKFRGLAPIKDDFAIAAAGLGIAKAAGSLGLSKFSADELEKVIKNVVRFRPTKLVDIVKHNPNLADEEKAVTIFDKGKAPEMAKLIQNALVSKGLDIDIETGEYKDEDVALLAKLGISTTDLVKKAAFKKAVSAMQNKDLETASKKLIDNEEFKEVVARFKDWSFIHKMMDEWGSDVAEKLQNKAEEVEGGVKSIAKTNPTFIRAATTQIGKLFMRDWMVNGVVQTDPMVKDLVAMAARTVSTLPLNLLGQENSFVRDLARANYATDPTKSLANYMKEQEQEYRKKYRNNIYAKIQTPEAQSWLNRRTNIEFGGNRLRADIRRFEEVARQEMEKENLPVIKALTETEKKEYKKIVDGAKTIPAKPNQTNLRKVQGAIRIMFNAVQQKEREIEKRAHELEQRRLNATPAEIAALDKELNNLENKWKDYQSRYDVLKNTNDSFKSTLNIK